MSAHTEQRQSGNGYKGMPDPIAALPTSHTKKYLPRQQTWAPGSGPASPHFKQTPKPIFSEYEQRRVLKNSFRKLNLFDKKLEILLSNLFRKLNLFDKKLEILLSNLFRKLNLFDKKLEILLSNLFRSFCS
jgi:hypothetical protein